MLICSIINSLFKYKSILQQAKEIKLASPFKQLHPTKKFDTIQMAVEYLLSKENITTRNDLNNWCDGESREKLYIEIKKTAPDAWDRAADPNAKTRYAYQKVIQGYSVNK
jgi:hypothetical protein